MAPQDIKLTPTSYAVLGLIDLAGSATPYDLKRAIEMSVENFWPVPHTTFYAEPERLTKAGYLSEQREQHGRRRRIYSLTETGREALRAWVADPDVAPPALRDEAMLKVFLGADPVPLLRARMAHHRAKLEELEGYLEAVRAGDATPGIETSLVVGTSYERHMLTLLGEFAGDED
jgi:PadR family transcriptional regulator, regulatory protein AphA